MQLKNRARRKGHPRRRNASNEEWAADAAQKNYSVLDDRRLMGDPNSKPGELSAGACSIYCAAATARRASTPMR